MILRSCTLFILSIYLSFNTINAQSVEITNWLNDSKSATVMTFDDWSPAHPEIAVPQLISHNLVGTFFVTTGNAWRSNDYATMNNAIANGIEIGNHTLTHPNLTLLNSTDLVKEIDSTKKILDENLTEKVITLAYPLGSFNNNVITATSSKHIAARTVFSPSSGNWDYNFDSSPTDYFKMPTFQVNNSVSLNDYKTEIEIAMTDGGLMTLMYHSIFNSNGDGDTWFDAMDETDFVNQLTYLQTVKNQTWITTFSNAVRYHQEKKVASVGIIDQTDTTITLSLTDALVDNDLYNQELTIKLSDIGSKRFTAFVQNGDTLKSSLSGHDQYYLIDAIPDAGSIIGYRDTLVGLNDVLLNGGINVFPSPNSGNFTIEIDLKQPSWVTINVTDILGRSVLHIIPSTKKSGLTTIPIQLDNASTGTYILNMLVNDRVVSRLIKVVN